MSIGLGFNFKLLLYTHVLFLYEKFAQNRSPDPHKKHVIMKKVVNIIMSWPIKIGSWYFIERFGVANPQIWITKCWFDRGQNERIYIIKGLFTTVKLLWCLMPIYYSHLGLRFWWGGSKTCC